MGIRGVPRIKTRGGGKSDHSGSDISAGKRQMKTKFKEFIFNYNSVLLVTIIIFSKKKISSYIYFSFNFFLY